MKEIIDLLLHTDKIIAAFFQEHGVWVYVLLVAIIFTETGVVVFPFLPGDSLLFTAGMLSAGKGLDLFWLLGLLPCAAILGDSLNYSIGHWTGGKVSGSRINRWIKPGHLRMAHDFFEKWGGWAITLCRFFPILRTVTPFLGGVSRMNFLWFTFFNILGGFSWCALFLLLGYFFGNLPFVKDHFFWVMLSIIGLSLIPIGLVAMKKWRSKKTSQNHAVEESCE